MTIPQLFIAFAAVLFMIVVLSVLMILACPPASQSDDFRRAVKDEDEK